LINPSVPPKMAAGSDCDGIGVLEVAGRGNADLPPCRTREKGGRG
jgi:hypothetical protein